MFRLAHHRTPDRPGAPWARVADISHLPARWVDCFSHIEAITYQIGQEKTNDGNTDRKNKVSR